MNFDEIVEKFKLDKFATDRTGIVIDSIIDDVVKCSFEIKPHHKNGVGLVMGGAIFTLADFATAVSSNLTDIVSVTISSNINFCGATKGDKLIAESKCIKKGRTTSVYEVSVQDNLGNLVAYVTNTVFTKA